MALRNVAKTFSLEEQRVEINELAADLNSLNLSVATLSSFSVTTNTTGISALSYNSTSGVFTYTPPDLSGYLTTGSVAGGITSANITDWNTAYGWGDHSQEGYLTSASLSANVANWNAAYNWGDHAQAGYLTSETDPVFSASDAANVTNALITSWDTAYGWGDHSAAGYLTTYGALNNLSDVTIASVQTGDILSFNGSSWVNIPSSTAASISDTPPSSPNPGDLWWESDTGRLKVYYQDTDTSQWVDASPPLANPFNVTAADAANWNTAYGWGDHAQEGYLTAEVDTIATVVGRGDIIGNNTPLKFGDAAPTQIYYDNTNNVTAFESNALIFRTKTTPNEDYITCLEGGSVEIYYDGVKKLGTVQTGVSVLGDLSVSGDVITSKLIHDSDIDTYLSFDTDIIKLTTAGSERITIGSSGQLGLGGSNYGSSGEVLTSNGPSAAPTWQAASGGGGSSPLVASETFNITVISSSTYFYNISGNDRYGEVGGDDVPVRIYTGDTVTFDTSALSGADPLYIRVSPGGASVSNPAATGEGTSSISWTPSATGIYYYQSSDDPVLRGYIYVEDPINAEPTITVKNTNIEGDWEYAQGNDLHIQSLSSSTGAIPGHNSARNNLPQYMPAYSDSAGNLPPISNPPDHPDPVSLAFDARYDTWLNVASSVDNGVIELTFTHPIMIDNLYELTIGYDGNVQPGYNGGNYVTTTTTTNDIQEITLKAAGSGNGYQLDKLSFKTVTASGATGRLYYVIASFGGSTGMMVYKSYKVGIGNAGRKFYRHDSSVNLQLGAEHLNSIIGVNTYISRSLVLPIHYMCREGDTITVMDIGVGRLDKDSPDDYANALSAGYGMVSFNAGNATTHPISIFPGLEQGIQSTNYGSSPTLGNSGDDIYWLPTVIPNTASNNKYYNSGWHGMPFVINRSGQSVTFVFCGGLYGWRILS